MDIMLRTPPKLTREEAYAQMMAWLFDPTSLERVRRAMPEGATLEDALRFHRRCAQEGRRYSRVMRDEGDEVR